MSDSQPPVWGPAYDERDLDNLLSGQSSGVPGPLRTVAATLAALRAGPVPAELDREAAARAAFRLFMLPEESEPASTAAAAGPPPRPGVPRLPDGPRRGRWAAAVLLGAAAVAVLVLVAVLPGAGGSSGTPGRGPGDTHAAAGSSGASPKSPVLDGGGRPSSVATAARKPAATPGTAPGASAAPGLAQLCRRYFAFFADPGPPASRAAKRSAFQELSSAAGGPGKIAGFCARLAGGSAQPAEPDRPGPFPGSPAAGNNPPGSGLSGVPGLPGIHGGPGSGRNFAGPGARGQR